MQQQQRAGECVVSSQILVEQVNKGEDGAGEVLMAVVMKLTVFWNDTTYSSRKWPTYGPAVAHAYSCRRSGQSVRNLRQTVALGQVLLLSTSVFPWTNISTNPAYSFIHSSVTGAITILPVGNVITCKFFFSLMNVSVEPVPLP